MSTAVLAEFIFREVSEWWQLLKTDRSPPRRWEDSNLSMGKRFESGVSKCKGQRLEHAMMMKLRPITAFVHQPLIEATRASSEAIQPEPITSMQPDKNLPEKETVKQDVEQQADYEEAAMMLAQTENIELIQESLTG
ncbi:UNVERIFIED_CONTAM: hypothetical protein K2H54_058883 [Gekko kuhli]